MDKKFNNPLEADAHNWDTRELPDNKLSEEIAEWLLKDNESGLKIGVGKAEWLADQLLALIKQAGWNPPEDNASIYQTLANMHKWAKAAGYVQLDPDQTPPTSSMAYPSGNYQSAH